MGVGAHKVHKGSVNTFYTSVLLLHFVLFEGFSEKRVPLNGIIKDVNNNVFFKRLKYLCCLDTFSDALCNKDLQTWTWIKSTPRKPTETLLCYVLMSCSAAFCRNRVWTGRGRILKSDMTACSGKIGTTMKRSEEICLDPVGPPTDISQWR